MVGTAHASCVWLLYTFHPLFFWVLAPVFTPILCPMSVLHVLRVTVFFFPSRINLNYKTKIKSWRNWMTFLWSWRRKAKKTVKQWKLLRTIFMLCQQVYPVMKEERTRHLQTKSWVSLILSCGSKASLLVQNLELTSGPRRPFLPSPNNVLGPESFFMSASFALKIQILLVFKATM